MRYGMTKEELHALAAPGVAQKVAAIEAELATYHKEWPELFLSPTPPQLLKAQPRSNGNGHWPMVATKKSTESALTTTINASERRASKNANISASWTPARRAKMSRLMKMKKRQKALHAAKARKKKQAMDVS